MKSRFCLYWLLAIQPYLTRSTESSRGSQFTPEDVKALRRYAKATWKYMDAAVNLTSGIPLLNIPVDKLNETESYDEQLAFRGTITNVANYLWSVIVARDLQIITPLDALDRASKILQILNHLENYNGYFFKVYNTKTLQPIKDEAVDTVDLAWLAAGLILVKHAFPELREPAENLISGMDFNKLRNTVRPKARGLFCRIYKIDEDNSNCEPYKWLNAGPRLIAYIAIARGQVRQNLYFKLTRTMINDCNYRDMEMMPGGTFKQYMGVQVFEGHFNYSGMKIVPSNHGAMFNALFVPLIVPEVEWGPKSWGINHPLWAKAQIEHGMNEARYGLWGFNNCINPSTNEWAKYGLDVLGNIRNGFYSNNDKTGVDYGYPGCPARPPQKIPGPKEYTNGVVTPSAIFMALAFVPKEAMEVLKKLEDDHGMFSKHGFYDSLNVQTGEKAKKYVTINQGMIMAALGNALSDNCLHRYFEQEPGMKELVKPLLAMEEFTAGYF